MARLGLVCLILTGILMLQVVADATDFEEKNPFGGARPWSVEESNGPASSPVESREAEAPESRRMGKHHSTDASVAGGGVIVGGLITAVFAAVYCYIRVTRKRANDEYNDS